MKEKGVMKGKSQLLTCLVALLIISTISTVVVNVQSTPLANTLPKVYVDPPSVVVNASCSFTVDIKVSNAVDMWGFEFRLSWNPSFLEVQDDPGTQAVEGVTEGPFLIWGGPSPPEATYMISQLNNNTGTLRVVNTILGVPLIDADPASGNGTLATVTFILVGAHGSSTLDLSNTVVIAVDPVDPYNPKPTDHTTEDGSYSDVGYEVKICQIASKTVMCQGYSGKINATIRNVGGTAQTVDVTAYYNSSSWSIIGTQSETLNSGETKTITYTWNVNESVSKGNHLIKINVTAVGGVNIYISDYTIRVTMTGDIAAEFNLVDIVDIVSVAIHFGAKIGDPEYDPIADIDDTGEIDIVDIVIVAIHFGETDP